MSGQTLHFVAPQDFHQRAKTALGDPKLRASFRGAMDFLQTKRSTQFPDADELEQLRDLGEAIRQHALANLPQLLVQLLGALYLGLSKRRAEIVALAGDATGHRRSLAHYSPYLLDQMIGVVTASTLLAYAFYTISDRTVSHFGTDRLVWTVPFPLYGIFRYLYLVHQREGGGNPSDTLLEDRPILVCVALWGATVIAMLYGPLR